MSTAQHDGRPPLTAGRQSIIAWVAILGSAALLPVAGRFNIEIVFDPYLNYVDDDGVGPLTWYAGIPGLTLNTLASAALHSAALTSLAMGLLVRPKPLAMTIMLLLMAIVALGLAFGLSSGISGIAHLQHLADLQEAEWSSRSTDPTR
jgi:hypothetical protein